VLGITGTGGAGKSSLTDELVLRLRLDHGDRLKVAILSIDPSRKRTGGALLGDRIRMNAIDHPDIYMRSMATRDTGTEISGALPEAIAACRLSGFDLVIVETSGIGQGDAAIVPYVDLSLYVMTPEFGAASQLEKIDMLDFADFVAINKFDRKGAEDALRDVRKQYQRNRELFGKKTDEMPVFGTQASRFNDDGVTALYQALLERLKEKGLKAEGGRLPRVSVRASSHHRAIVPPERSRYLAEIADTLRGYHARVARDARAARERQALATARAAFEKAGKPVDGFDDVMAAAEGALSAESKALLESWPKTVKLYSGDEHVGKTRDKESRTKLVSETLSGSKIRKVVLAALRGRGRDPALPDAREPARLLPVHRRRLPVQARERGPDAHVRGGGRRVPHQQALQEGLGRDASASPFHRLRLGDALRLRPRRAPRHLRQGGQLGRVDRHTRRHEGPLRWIRPLRADHVGIDDDQRPRADHPRVFLQHGDRSIR
jgi:methylmalonyl-CoA mutase